MRLQGKIAVVIGAGQGPGEGLGNGRATVLRFVAEGARVLAVDRDLASAEETAAMAARPAATASPSGPTSPTSARSPRRSPTRTGAGAGSTSCTTTSG